METKRKHQMGAGGEMKTPSCVAGLKGLGIVCVLILGGCASLEEGDRASQQVYQDQNSLVEQQAQDYELQQMHIYPGTATPEQRGTALLIAAQRERSRRQAELIRLQRIGNSLQRAAQYWQPQQRPQQMDWQDQDRFNRIQMLQMLNQRPYGQ